MKSRTLPITLCHAPCPSCGIETDFEMFESGGGGDFETYIGNESGAIYRLDMNKVHYLNCEPEELLAPVVEKEGGAQNLRNIPDQVKCKSCGHIFRAMPITIASEKKVSAFEL